MQKIYVEFCYSINEAQHKIFCEPGRPFSDYRELARQFVKEIDAVEDVHNEMKTKVEKEKNEASKEIVSDFGSDPIEEIKS